jgi:hypothetical protein
VVCEAKAREKGARGGIGESLSDVNPINLPSSDHATIMSYPCWSSEAREVELWENERFDIDGRSNRFAQILFLILQPRPIRNGSIPVSDSAPTVYSLFYLPPLHCQLLLKRLK